MVGAGPGRVSTRRMGCPRIGVIDDGPMWGLRSSRVARASTTSKARRSPSDYRSAGGPRQHRLFVARQTAGREIQWTSSPVYGTLGGRASRSAGDADHSHRRRLGWAIPVGAGLVSSFAQPGGDITGNTILGPEVADVSGYSFSKMRCLRSPRICLSVEFRQPIRARQFCEIC